MKKALLLLMFLPIMFNVSAQNQVNDVGIDSISISETERIIDKYSEKITNGFNDMAKEVAPLAEQGFEISVKYQKAKGISTLAFSALFLLIPLIVIYFTVKHEKDLDEEVTTPIFITSILSFVFAVANIIIVGASSVQRIISPEWFAIKDIIELI